MEPHDIGKLIKGIKIDVYQTKSYLDNPDSWHAHISGGHLTETEIENAGCQAIRSEKGEWWIRVSSSGTEDEAREKACTVIGSIFGQRLAKMLDSQVVPEPIRPIKRRVLLGC